MQPACAYGSSCQWDDSWQALSCMRDAPGCGAAGGACCQASGPGLLVLGHCQRGAYCLHDGGDAVRGFSDNFTCVR